MTGPSAPDRLSHRPEGAGRGRGVGDWGGWGGSSLTNLTAEQLLEHITEQAADAPEPTGTSGVIFNNAGSVCSSHSDTMSQVLFQMRPTIASAGHMAAGDGRAQI